jgi:hypothetical protein
LLPPDAEKRDPGPLKWLNPIRLVTLPFALIGRLVLRLVKWRFGPLESGWVGFLQTVVLLVVLTWAVILMLLAVDFLLVPGGVLALLYLLGRTLSTWPEWVVLVALMIFAAWSVSAGTFWTQWIPWSRREEPDSSASAEEFLALYREVLSSMAPVVDAYRALLMLTGTFAGLTAVLAAHGWLATTADGGSAHLVWETLAYYTWHFLDAIPVLKVPQTLNWKLGTKFTDYGSGALLLAYKLLVIVPVVRAIMELVKRRRDEATPVGKNA